MPAQTSDPTPVPSRPTGILPALSRLGLGAWAFGGVGWGPQDDRDSTAAIARAGELGINWIDTAAVYGGGHAESVVGAALSALPAGERPLVFTKGGVRIDAQTGKTYRDLTPASLRLECDASLQRLRVDRIDVYQLHWPVADAAVVEQAWAALGELQREGKIRWAGLSNFERPMLERCSRIRPIDFVQAPLSLLERRTCEQVLPWAASHHATVLAYSPLESGLLSGRFSRERLRNLPSDDWRRHRAQFQSPSFDRALALVDRLRPIAEELGISIPELAIGWVLSRHAAVRAIVGARDAAQVENLAGAGRISLADATLAAITAAIAATGAGAGPTDRPGEANRDSARPSA